MLDQPLKSKVAIVTGAGHPKGIGWAAARKLAEHGADIVLADLPNSIDPFGGEAVETLVSLGAKAFAFKLDVSDANQITKCVAQAKSEFGGVDILFNNAGVGVGSDDFLQLTERDWDLSYQVNVKGLAMFCQAVLPVMIERGGGAIINNASLSGLGAIRSIPACYTASKYAAIGLTKAIAADFGDRGVRCNAICPGTIDTQMRSGALKLFATSYGVSIEKADEMEREMVPLGRPGAPEEVGDLVAYLAGPHAGYITGAAIPVAGGMSPGL